MRPTSVSSLPASTAGSSSPDAPPRPGGVCAIHQPNFFPRLSTLAKLYAADYWIVLDDVQFARRDYQHRTRLAALDDPGQRRWLSLATHLPHGRSTLIRDARLVEPARCRRRVDQMIAQHYWTSAHRPALRVAAAALLDGFGMSDRTAEITEVSTRVLLDLLGWRGQVIHSSDLPARSGRSQRLADLAAATGADAYLCGTGGMRYLVPELFWKQGISVVPFRIPAEGVWACGREVSALLPLMAHGVDAVARDLAALAMRTRGGGARLRHPAR